MSSPLSSIHALKNLLFLALASLVLDTNSNAKPPNVVILLADDAGWGDYGFNGNAQVRTPHIDSISKEGATLTQFYVCPVCSPTRAEMLTGRYHTRCGVTGVSLGQERLNLGETTLAEVFQNAGYATGIFGKWHNGSQWPYHPMARGFDTFFGYTSGHWGEYFNPPLELDGRMQKETGYIVDICTDRALNFIEKHKDRPFLCYVPFTTPHSPWAVPEKNWAHWKDRPLEKFATVPANERPDETRCALAMVENQDENVGRILGKLKELQLEEDTIVLYFSDNGPNTPRWNGGLKGIKGSVDEGGIRAPFAIRWPGKIPSGRKISEIGGAIDLLPTLASLTGIPLKTNAPLDGVNLSPLLSGKKVNWPDRMLFSFRGGATSVRTQRFRLASDGKLFDMIKDPGQMEPCNQSEPEVTEILLKATAQWRSETGADLIKREKGNAPDPRPFPIGYREFPITMLPARDGEPKGGLKRSAAAPNSSYFVDWNSTAAYASWNVEVHTAGNYQVSIDYTCAAGNENCVLLLEFGDAKLSSKVPAAWDPPLHTNQDTIPRHPQESRMKDFANFSMGTVHLPSGPGELRLRAAEIPGKGAIDLRRITLTLLN